MMALQYLLTVYLVVNGFFTAVMLIVALALREFMRILPMFRAPKPEQKPPDYPDVWPNWFVAAAFVHNRAFGLMFMLSLILDTVLKAWVL
jgi:1,4-dihydroxy-2-naphthoate octaprenyltransferase